MEAYYRSPTMSPLHRKSNLFGPFPVDLRDPYIYPYPRPPFISTFPFPGPAASSPIAGPCVDWKETREAHVFIADVPGLRKEEVLVEVEEGNVLKISGGRTVEKERSETWHRAERTMGSFLRRFQLPENTRADRAIATMENGVLTVTIPKKEPKRPKINSIEIYA